MPVWAKIGSSGVVATALCAGALALAAGPAWAEPGGSDMTGSSIKVSAPPVHNGQALQITASGTNVAQTGVEAGFTYNVSLFWVDPVKVPLPKPGPCLPQREAEENLVYSNSRYAGIITIGSPNVGLGGPFSFTFPTSSITGVGPIVICAYDNLAGGSDAAWASTMTKLLPAAKGTTTTTTSTSTSTTPAKPKVGAAKPKAIGRPQVTRAGSLLVCQRGNWSGKPEAYAFKWTVVHKHGVAGRKSVLHVTAAMRGHQVECSVTAESSVGSGTAVSRPIRIR